MRLKENPLDLSNRTVLSRMVTKDGHTTDIYFARMPERHAFTPVSREEWDSLFIDSQNYAVFHFYKWNYDLVVDGKVVPLPPPSNLL